MVLVLPALARAEDRHCVFVAASDDGALRIWTTAFDQAAHSGHKPCFRWAHVPMPYGSAPDELTMTRL